MALRPIVDGAYLVTLGPVNAVLLDAGPELVLVDTGFPGKERAILAAVRRLGRQPGDIRHIVLTHAHADHIGSAAALVRATGARTYMHGADTAIAESGGPFRPMVPGRGLLQRALYAAFWRPEQRVEPVRIDQHLADGEELPLAGGLRVVHTPGHCAGQVSLLWQGGRMLLTADAMTHLIRLGDPLGFEDVAAGRRSQRLLAGLHFDAAVFGHGRPIRARASERFRRRWLRHAS